MSKHVYVTLNGLEVPIRAVSLYEISMAEAGLKQEYLDRGEPLDPPTYTVELAGGVTQTFDHDESSLRTDEDREAWAAHVDALGRFLRDANKLRGQIVLEDGIALQMPKDDGWRAKQERRHVKIPTGATELREHWLVTEVLQTNDDILGVIAEVLKLSARGAADPAAVEAAIDGFRRRVPTNGEVEAEATGPTDSEEKPVETREPVKRTSRGKRVAKATK